LIDAERDLLAPLGPAARESLAEMLRDLLATASSEATAKVLP
jgi:hypothetical protein